MPGIKNLEDFLRLHYGNQMEPYSSHILFMVRKSCSSRMQWDKFLNTRFFRDNTRDKYLDCILEHAATRFDHYITPNGFKKYNSREKKNLQSIHNLVLDFDCHVQGMTLQNYHHMCDAVSFWIQSEAAYVPGLVIPDTLVFTGRGIQMWYALEPVAAGLAGLCKAVIFSLLKNWQDFFDKFDLLSNLKADWHASANLNGLMRLPGTWNNHTQYGSFEILRRDVWEIHDLMEAIGMPSVAAEKSKKQKKIRKKTIENRGNRGGKPGEIKNNKKTADRRNGAQARVRGLWKLAEMRIQSGDYIGQRDLLCFFTFLACKWAGYSNEECMAEAYRMNDGFPIPLRQHELENYLSSAARKGYFYRSRKIIEELRITKEEEILTGISGMTERERLSSIGRARKTDRDNCIIRLSAEGKLSKSEIAREAGCSVKTVYNVISRYVKSMEEQQEPAGTEMPDNEAVVLDTAVNITGKYMAVIWPCIPVFPCLDGFPPLPAGPGG